MQSYIENFKISLYFCGKTVVEMQLVCFQLGPLLSLEPRFKQIGLDEIWHVLSITQGSTD